MTDWLKSHVFIAAWASPIIALLGIMLRGTMKGSEVDWSKAVFNIAILSLIAIEVTPGVDSTVRWSFMGLLAVMLGSLMRNIHRD